MTEQAGSVHLNHTELSKKDMQIYARQLVAVTIDEHLRSGKFDEDLAFFNENAQTGIRSELKRISREFHGSESNILPRHSKPGRPKKGQIDAESN